MTKDDLDDAVYDFIKKFAFIPPEIPECKVMKGYQNRIPLPSKPADYIVFFDIGDEGREQGMEGFSYDITTRGDGVQTVANLRIFNYQITSVGKYAKRRLNRLTSIFNSSKGAEFFRSLTKNKYGGASPVRAGRVIDTTHPDGTTDNAFSYIADFRVAARLAEGVPQDWADEVKPKLRPITGKK